MPAVVLIGAQWGDEGKGKATDLLGGRGDLGTRRRLTRHETAQVELDEGHADTLPPASRSIAGDESRGSTARCRQSC